MEVNIVNDFVVSKPDPVMIPDDAMKELNKKEINVKYLVYIIVALAITVGVVLGIKLAG